jgi:hypothetical protein
MNRDCHVVVCTCDRQSTRSSNYHGSTFLYPEQDTSAQTSSRGERLRWSVRLWCSPSLQSAMQDNKSSASAYLNKASDEHSCMTGNTIESRASVNLSLAFNSPFTTNYRSEGAMPQLTAIPNRCTGLQAGAGCVPLPGLSSSVARSQVSESIRNHTHNVFIQK